jgi:hypothetical protein
MAKRVEHSRKKKQRKFTPGRRAEIRFIPGAFPVKVEIVEDRGPV